MFSNRNSKKYLKAFFEEKDLPSVTWDIPSTEDGFNIISNDVVIEHIMNASVQEQDAIAGIVRKIDFANGDINHFLEHLANALVRKNEE